MKSLKENLYRLSPSGSHRWHDVERGGTWVVLVDDADAAVWNQVGHFVEPQAFDMIYEDLITS